MDGEGGVMPRRFVTEKDIEDLFRQGERSLEVTEGMVLTDMAYEKARQRGIQLIAGHIPSAPVRPYLVNKPTKKTETEAARTGHPEPGLKQPVDLSKSGLKRDELHERIRAAVARKLGDQVDPKVVETIIRRILDSTGVR
jgi:hypothetical protein